MSAVDGMLEGRHDRVERVGRTFVRHLGWSNRATKKLKQRERRGLDFRWLPVDGGTQQPTKSWHNRRNIVWGEGVQDVDDGGGCCCIVSAVELRGKK